MRIPKYEFIVIVGERLKYNTIGANDKRLVSLFSFYYRLVCGRLFCVFAIIVLEFIIPSGV